MPSEKVLAIKQEEVAQLAEELKNAQTVVVVASRGLTVAEDTELRAELRKSGVTYKVVKNTMLRRASASAGIEGMDEVFTGPSAIAYSNEDPVAPARVVKQFADKFDPLQLKGGIFHGTMTDKETIMSLASIPPIEVLYAQVVGGIAAPLTGLALMISAIQKKAEETGAATAAEVAVGAEASAEEAPAAEAAEEAPVVEEAPIAEAAEEAPATESTEDAPATED